MIVHDVMTNYYQTFGAFCHFFLYAPEGFSHNVQFTTGRGPMMLVRAVTMTLPLQSGGSLFSHPVIGFFFFSSVFPSSASPDISVYQNKFTGNRPGRPQLSMGDIKVESRFCGGTLSSLLTFSRPAHIVVVLGPYFILDFLDPHPDGAGVA